MGPGKSSYRLNLARDLMDSGQVASSDIGKFRKVSKIIKWTMPTARIIPIRIIHRMFFLSKGFSNKMGYPLIAQFLGTGNQIANVSCTVLERLLDEARKLLGKTATMEERYGLGGANFFDDITIIHSDSNYFRKHYEASFDPELCAEPRSKA